jgi:hypothetical protein
MVNLAEKISTDYEKFGTLLLNDEDGSVINAIVKEHRGRSEDINHAILCRWLQGRGKPRLCTWITLVDVLKDMKRNKLAQDILGSLQHS